MKFEKKAPINFTFFFSTLFFFSAFRINHLKDSELLSALIFFVNSSLRSFEYYKTHPLPFSFFAFFLSLLFTALIYKYKTGPPRSAPKKRGGSEPFFVFLRWMKNSLSLSSPNLPYSPGYVPAKNCGGACWGGGLGGGGVREMQSKRDALLAQIVVWGVWGFGYVHRLGVWTLLLQKRKEGERDVR